MSFPWSTVITGVVGLAGIGGTLWQGKRARETASKDLRESLHANTRNLLLSISAENYRQHRAEKKEIYAACLAELAKMVQAAVVFATRWTSTNNDVREDAVENFDRAVMETLVISGASGEPT
jgi:hypothetical protein